jgi:hypothetical protein
MGKYTRVFGTFLAALGAISTRSAVHATPLSELAASIEPGTFAELEFPGVNLGDVVRVCASNSNILEYADSAAWDPLSHQVLFLGTSHGSCYGSKFIIYSEDEHQWREGPLPDDPCIAPMTDHCFAHAYSHNTIDPDTGIVYYRHYGDETVWQFDTRGSETWSVHSEIATRRGESGCCNGLEFLPSETRSGLLYVDGSEGVYFGTEPGRVWELLANTALHWEDGLTTLEMADHDNFAELDPVHGNILFGGGDNPPTLYTYDESGEITPRGRAPEGVTTSSTRGIVSVDPVSGRFLFFVDDGSFWEYDTTSEVWTRQPGEHPLHPYGYFEAFEVPITTYGVILFLVWQFDETSVWLYKHMPSEPPLPRDGGAPPIRRDGGGSIGEEDASAPRRDGSSSAERDAGGAISPAPSGCACRAQAGGSDGAGVIVFASLFWLRRRTRLKGNNRG